MKPSNSRQYSAEYTRGRVHSLEEFVKNKVGNCGEMAMLAAVLARRLGLEANVWSFPNTHDFCIVGHIPNSISSMAAGTEFEHLWTLDPWSGICCRSNKYDKVFERKMGKKWDKNGKIIYNGSKWIKPNSSEWLKATVQSNLPKKKGTGKIPGYSPS